MSNLRMPAGHSSLSALEASAALLDQDLLAEKAATLGRMGQKVATALAALRAHDGGESPEAERDPLLKAASHAVWGYFIQRELCGLRSHAGAIEHYAIPREVLRRLGAF